MGILMAKGLQESYNNLEVKNNDCLYICTDTGNMYIGDLLIDKNYIDTYVSEINSEIAALQTQVSNLFNDPAAIRTTLDVYSKSEVNNATVSKAEEAIRATVADSADAVAWANVSDKPTEFTPAAHDASKITSGTLPIARGGTGLTASPSMTVNLASTAAADVFAASPSPGVTGTLPVANGGTGATTFTSGAALIGNGTGAITTRGITNNTSKYGSFTGTNLITANTLQHALNRSTSVAYDDTNYTTYMARGEALFSTATVPSINGAIAWTYS